MSNERRRIANVEIAAAPGWETARNQSGVDMLIRPLPGIRGQVVDTIAHRLNARLEIESLIALHGSYIPDSEDEPPLHAVYLCSIEKLRPQDAAITYAAERIVEECLKETRN